MRTTQTLAGATLMLLLLLLAAGPAAADPTLCTYGAMERTIEVVYETPGEAVPCEVVYDKLTEGGRTVPWRARNEAGFCEARAAELVEKLEANGWACTDAPRQERSGG